MTVTIINRQKGIEIQGVHVEFFEKWKRLGFEIKRFECSNITMLRAG